MKIYIPTIGRADKQRTAEVLRAAGLDFVLVTSDTDPASYAGWPHVVIEEYGIRDRRQWILDNAEEDKVIMMDDDLRFFFRAEEKKFRQADPTEVACMVNAVVAMLDHYAHGGVTDRFMCNAQPRIFKENSRYYHILAYNKALFPDPAPRYTLYTSEEQEMNLKLLTAGKKNFVITEWTTDDVPYAPGGCSMWRTPDLETQEAKKLAEMFPGIVTNTGGPKNRIAWKKAAQQGGCA